MNDLVKSISLENLDNQRQAFLRGVDELLETIKRLDTLSRGFVAPAKYSHVSGSCTFDQWFTQRERYGQVLSVTHEDDDPKEEIRNNVDRWIWSMVMHDSGMLTLMDATARRKWQDDLHSDRLPAATIENIRQTFRELHGSRRDLFERGVIESFRSLSWDYKTNNPCAFGKRIIMDYMVSYHTRTTAGPGRPRPTATGRSISFSTWSAA